MPTPAPGARHPLDEILLYAAIGFLAQLVDGAIGMAYGLMATSVLMAHAVPPAVASAGVHAAEVATTGLSGLAHWRLGHVMPRLMWRLALPGVAGGVAGALVAGSLPMHLLKPAVSLYLLAMGLLVLRRAVLGVAARNLPGGLRPAALGAAGGFLDAIGGGGWGPLVTSTLIGRGLDPKLAIGSSNAAEFFVTTAATAAFLTTIGIGIWPVVAGLVLGGALAAPLAALATRHIPARPLMGMVGTVIVLLAGSALGREFGLFG
ncbi:sulfite exporter TauE/SafE family protein [Roseomonas rosulenta]|uniref:sulfite exporter TauE/SafE family protein n=1 Tax=Roseomonas rosulenta TaxID=2748667 RepID=UPI0034E265A8